MRDVKPETNHRYAVVVQDLATQWIQSHPCKTKSAHETEESFLKFQEPSHRPKVVCADNSMELQSRLDERWSDSMFCFCYLRNVQDLLADGNHSKDQ